MDTLRIVIIGSGPVGMTTALLLARQGHAITLVDRDPGPVPGQEWDRVGVMQFRLPHGLRPQAHGFLAERLPDVHRALLEAGALLRPIDTAPGDLAMMGIRREVLERVLWESTTPEVTRLTGHVDTVIVEDGRAVGVMVDGRRLEADAVIDASGRAGRVARALRPEAEGADSEMAYAARLFRLRPGAEPGPLNGGPGYITEHPGFLQLIFEHDSDTFTVLLVRPRSDRELVGLREEGAFSAAVAVLPGAREWTDAARCEPIDGVRAGSNLLNRYQGQPVGVTGLVSIGDALCTTNPSAARGLVLGFRTAGFLADLVAERPMEEWGPALDEWAADNVRPWFDEHMVSDTWQVTAWEGGAPDPDGPVPSALVAAAAQESHPEWQPVLGAVFGMALPPAVLDPMREQVRTMVREGWRPAPPGGPTRAELLAAMSAVGAEEVAEQAGALVGEHA